MKWEWMGDNACTFAEVDGYELVCILTRRPYRRMFQRRGPYYVEIYRVIDEEGGAQRIYRSRKQFARVAEARAWAVKQWERIAS